MFLIHRYTFFLQSVAGIGVTVNDFIYIIKIFRLQYNQQNVALPYIIYYAINIPLFLEVCEVVKNGDCDWLQNL